jgi:hypothetical protein
MPKTSKTVRIPAPKPAQQDDWTPVLRYRDLRGLAEYASGVRECDQTVWLAACGDGVIHRVADPANMSDLPVNVLVATEVGDGRGNCDTTHFARIGQHPGEYGSVDLLDILFRGKHKAADSVFWTQSAVEKFMVPYYASVYAGEAATMIGAILGLLGSTQSISGEIEGTQYEVFAVIHLPQSEYVGVNEASALPGDLAVGLRAPDGTHRAVHVWDLV